MDPDAEATMDWGLSLTRSLVNYWRTSEEGTAPATVVRQITALGDEDTKIALFAATVLLAERLDL